MITFSEAVLAELSIHRVGNKHQDEFYVLSDQPVSLADEMLKSLLMQYFVLPFTNVNELYHFNDLAVHPLYAITDAVFKQQISRHEGSMQIAKNLYDNTISPKTKGGELYIAFFKNLQIEGEMHEAIGVFKSEAKESYLKVLPQQGGFGLDYEPEAINIHKLDKGCLIFNTERDQGYKVAAVGLSGSSDPSWKDDFLKLMVRNDNFNQTRNVLGVYKSFVSEKLDDEFEISKADKIDLLNRSMKYFKEKEQFDLDEFSNEVIANEEGIALFKKYKQDYEEEFDMPIANQFNISDAAVKKQAKLYKRILKLDKNFHIYIHGNKELIEKGFDDNRAMNFYKVYFRDEQ